MSSEFASINSAIEDLKKGKFVIVVDSDERENEGDLVCLAEAATPANINFMTKFGKGLICVPITENYLNKLEIPLMVEDNQDKYGTAFTISVDHVDSGTGISAYARSLTILKLIEGASKPSDFNKPGHVFPLSAKSNGVLEREGHTEAAVDLAKLSNSSSAAVICEIINADGTMSRLQDLKVMSKKHNLKIVSIEDLVKYRKRTEKWIERKSVNNFTTENSKITVHTYKNKLTNKEQIIITKGGKVATSEPLIDFHIEYPSNDLLNSFGWNYDSGINIKESINKLEDNNNRILFYLKREDKNKAFFTDLFSVKQNNQMDYKDDFQLRDEEYFNITQILKDLGAYNIRLPKEHINSHKKILEYGINVGVAEVEKVKKVSI